MCIFYYLAGNCFSIESFKLLFYITTFGHLQSPVSRSTPSPSSGKPIAEVKYEAPKSIPKPRTPRTVTRPERSTPSSKPQPFSLSMVSMQNSQNKSENSTSENKVFETNVSGKKITGKTEKDLPAVSSGLKIERSKTTVNGRDLRKGKYIGASRQDSENKVPDKQDVERPDSFKYNVEKTKAILNDREINPLPTVKDTGKLTEDSANTHAKDKDKHIPYSRREKSSRVYGSHDRGRTKDAVKGTKGKSCFFSIFELS